MEMHVRVSQATDLSTVMFLALVLGLNLCLLHHVIFMAVVPSEYRWIILGLFTENFDVIILL